MKIYILFFTILLLSIFSCKKEECRECYIEEITASPADTNTISLGKKCGDEWKGLDGKTYVVIEGSAKSYCRK